MSFQLSNGSTRRLKSAIYISDRFLFKLDKLGDHVEVLTVILPTKFFRILSCGLGLGVEIAHHFPSSGVRGVSMSGRVYTTKEQNQLRARMYKNIQCLITSLASGFRLEKARPGSGVEFFPILLLLCKGVSSASTPSSILKVRTCLTLTLYAPFPF